MIDRILLPTDGEEGATNATQHAIELAAEHDAVLYVLYVVDETTYSAYPGDEYVHEDEGLEAALEHAGRDAIDAVTERATAAGVETHGDVQYGSPHDVIVDYADENDVDQIVMGSKQRSGEYRQLLGSVTDRVARLADRPVTIVKTAVEE